MYINHFVFVLDESSSMSSLRRKTIEVFQNQINNLKRKSHDLKQDTKVSVYTFADKVKCLAFDVDIERFRGIEGQYSPYGSTALMDAAGTAIEEHKDIPQKHGDHAFLLYVITDGEENVSRKFDVRTLRRLIDGLEDNWTVSCLVPNSLGKHNATQYGFPKNNIEIWQTTELGLEEVERTSNRAVNNYLNLRSQGIVGTRSFYSDLSDVTIKDAKAVAKELKPSEFNIFPVNKTTEIRPFVEDQLGTYFKGHAFYQLTKPESIQGYKQIAIRNRKNGKVFSGVHARDLLNLPQYDIKVSPGDHGDWDIFVQSTSTNRKLFPGSELLVLKAGF